MGTEPSEIVRAREHLSSFEKRMMDKDSTYHLSEGLLLLEEVLENDTGNTAREVARNIGNTYASKICSRIDKFLQDPKLTTEPELEHLFKLLLELDDSKFGDKAEIKKLKVETVDRLFEEYFRGYTVEDKKRAIKKLLEKYDT